MTKLPSNNTKISLIGLTVLGLSAIAMILYNIDKWLTNGIAVKRFTETCSGLGTGCSDAVTSILSIMGDPQQLLLSLAITALVVAFVKAVLVVVAAGKAASRYVIPGAAISRLDKILCDLNAADVRVRVADDNGLSAFTYGVIRPTICLSMGIIASLNDNELTALMAHEIGHVRRWDNFAIFVALFIRDFLWPLPISHHLFATFIREKEYAADDFAVDLTKNPLDLAGAIVSVAKATHGKRVLSPAYTAFFPGRATVKARIDRLIGSNERTHPSLSRLLVSIALSIVMIVGIVGFAYAQPSVNGASLDTCSMGESCSKQGDACYTLG